MDEEKKIQRLNQDLKRNLNRRQFLKLLGIGAGGAVATSAGLGFLNRKRIGRFMRGQTARYPSQRITGKQTGTSSFERPSISQTINLGDQGLSDGDNITSYIENNLNDGNRIVIPPGTYDYDGGALGYGGTGEVEVIGQGDFGDVVFEGPGNENMTHAGKVYIENITYPDSNTTMARLASSYNGDTTFNRVRCPNGPDDDEGFFTQPQAEGSIRFWNCEISNSHDNGLYLSAPYDPDSGNRPSKNLYAEVIGGIYKNNRIANIRVSGPATVRSVVSIQEAGVYIGAEDSHRALWCRDYGEQTIENVHIYNEKPYDSIICSSRDPGEVDWGHMEANTGNGIIRDCKIYTEQSGAKAVSMKPGLDWTVENTHVSGGGTEIDPPSNNITSGSDAESPKQSMIVLDPLTGEGLSYGPVGGETSSNPISRPTHTLKISSSNNRRYVFSANGLIEEEDINSNDRIFSNKAVGRIEGGGADSYTVETDTYTINGEITEFHASGDVNIEYKGESMTVEELQEICKENT